MSQKLKSITIAGQKFNIEQNSEIDLAGKADLVEGKVPITQLPSTEKEIINLPDFLINSTAGDARDIWPELPSGLIENKDIRVKVIKNYPGYYAYINVSPFFNGYGSAPLQKTNKFKNTVLRFFCIIPQGVTRDTFGGFQFNIHVPHTGPVDSWSYNSIVNSTTNTDLFILPTILITADNQINSNNPNSNLYNVYVDTYHNGYLYLGFAREEVAEFQGQPWLYELALYFDEKEVMTATLTKMGSNKDGIDDGTPPWL
jgi:hypothetical protein